MGKAHLESLLGWCFRDNLYPEAVRKARICIREVAYYRDYWGEIKQLIAQRGIGPESAYQFFNAAANLALDENSDAEVYRWLDLMVKNLAQEGGEIDVY
jgi:hypothetical protein